MHIWLFGEYNIMLWLIKAHRVQMCDPYEMYRLCFISEHLTDKTHESFCV